MTDPVIRFARRVLLAGLLVCSPSCLVYPRSDAPDWLALLCLLTSAVWAELRSQYVVGFGVLNFGEGLYVGAALRYGPVVGVLACLAGFVCDTVRKKDKRVRLFNCGWALVTFSVTAWAGLGFQPERGLDAANLGWAGLASLAYAFTAGWLQAECQMHVEGVTRGETLVWQAKLLPLALPGALLLGLLTQGLLGWAPAAIILVLFPIELLAAYVRVRELHQQLLQAQAQIQASSRQASLGVMAAGIAHEINNPLGAMKISLSMLQRQPLPESCLPSLNLLGQGIERCHSVTQRMLLYSRSQPEKGPSTAGLWDTIQDAQLFLHARLRHCSLEVDPAIQALPSVRINPGALVQILTNLLSNASDSGADSLRIQLRARVVTEVLELRCVDNGQGIPAANRGRIFEPFYTSKEPGRGTGLGLSISQTLARSAGGELLLEDSNSSGSTFLLRLRLD